MAVIRALPDYTAPRVPDDVVADHHILHYRPWRRPIAPRGEDNGGRTLALRPHVLEDVALDHHALGVLQFQEVLDRPPSSGRALSPGERLHEMIAPDLNVRRHQARDPRISTPEHDILARRLEIVVDDLEGP